MIPKAKASLIIMSHLSDVQEANNMHLSRIHINEEINFAKFLILKYGDNLNVEIDPDKEFKLFKNR
jgi:hypothetical protein